MEERTKFEHVARLVNESQTVLLEVERRMHLRRQRKPAEREEMGRALAGVVSACETIRLWLQAGAPE